MTKPFTSPPHYPLPHPIPYQQRDGYRADGIPRTPKWKVRTDKVYSASEYFWHYYYGPHPPTHIPIFLDTTPPLDTSPSNLTLLTKRELKNLVHHNNRLYSHNKELQKTAISIARLRIALNDLEKEVNNNEGRY